MGGGGGGGKILDISGGGWVIFPMKSQKFYGSFVNSGSGPQLHFHQNVRGGSGYEKFQQVLQH